MTPTAAPAATTHTGNEPPNAAIAVEEAQADMPDSPQPQRGRAAEQVTGLAAEGRLYPSVILHGGVADDRLDLAFELGRALLCEQAPERRPCGECEHCRRIDRRLICCLTPVPPASGKGNCRHCKKPIQATHHPDFVLLARLPKDDPTKKNELKQFIGIDQIRTMVQTAQTSPFEARGQVFVIADAHALHHETPDVLLKTLEEPSDRSPRNFLLLAPSANELLPTLRSRSLSVYLGGGEAADAAVDEELVADLIELWRKRPSDDALALWVSTLADHMVSYVPDKVLKDVQSRRIWTRFARALTDVAHSLEHRSDRAAALALAADLLDAHRLRLRHIRPDRIIAGLAARRLRRDQPPGGFESLVNELIGPP